MPAFWRTTATRASSKPSTTSASPGPGAVTVGLTTVGSVGPVGSGGTGTTVGPKNTAPATAPTANAAATAIQRRLGWSEPTRSSSSRTWTLSGTPERYAGIGRRARPGANSLRQALR